MRYRQLFDQWNNFSELESNWKEDLQLLTKDERKMEDAFYRDLEFGTGGMRGRSVLVRIV